MSPTRPGLRGVLWRGPSCPARAAARDPILALLLGPLRRLKRARWPSGFETPVTSITARQVNPSFACAVRARLVRAFGRTLVQGSETLFAFPAPERLAATTPEALPALRYS